MTCSVAKAVEAKLLGKETAATVAWLLLFFKWAQWLTRDFALLITWLKTRRIGNRKSVLPKTNADTHKDRLEILLWLKKYAFLLLLKPWKYSKLVKGLVMGETKVGAIDYYFYPTLTLTSSRQQAWLPPVFLFFNPTFLTCWKNQLPWVKQSVTDASAIQKLGKGQVWTHQPASPWLGFFLSPCNQ